VDDGDLVIRIGVDRFAWCLMHDDGPMRDFKITNALGFVADVIDEMEREDDRGGTPLGAFLDSMAKEAYEYGSPNIKEKAKRKQMEGL
jgi:hypothetical protein